jgi:hypothetical protein
MAAIQKGVTLRPTLRPAERQTSAFSVHDQAMDSIKRGVALRSTPRPPERRPGDEKVVDFASELRQKMMKHRKNETQSAAEKVQENREEIQKMSDAVYVRNGSPSLIHQLRGLLQQVDDFLRRINIAEDVLQQKAEWPSHLVADLREVLDYMNNMENKIKAADSLCKQMLQGSGAGVHQWRVNPQAVERCVADVVKIARELNSDESRYFRASQSFPVDRADLRSLVGRAGEAVTPLLDRLYEKALQSHQSVYDPTVSKYDLGFRLQSALRLLRMCCSMSDTLAMYLSVPRHPNYSDAQLKCQELESEFHKTMNIQEKRGDWDVEETLELQKPSTDTSSNAELNEEVTLTTAILEGVANGGAGLAEALADLTEQLYFKVEVQLIKAAVGTGVEKVIDDVMGLRERFSGDDDITKHRRDFDWLLEAVTKSNVELVKYLVEKHHLPVNCQSRDASNTVLHRAVQRQDFPMMSCLIKLGADPLLPNTAGRTPVQLLALKCFPPKHARAEEEREPLFDLSAYINSPNLSDVILVTSDNKQFHAHRLVLCAQSPVLKTLVDSDLWVESKNKEIPMPTISGRVLQAVLEYLYTGRCLFPPDDLNLGIELLVAADQLLLEPMKRKCEKLLSEKIDAEVAVPMYQAAHHYSAPHLLACSTHFMLMHYNEIHDPGHEALLQLLQDPPQH